MILELFGLPASGKTTLALKLSQGEGFKVIKVRSKIQLFWYNLLFFTSNPLRFFRLLFYVLSNIGDRRLFYFKIMNSFFDNNARYQKAKYADRSLLDQGYLQNILSLFEKELSSREIRSYLNTIPLPDKLIILKTSSEERNRRIQSRGYFARKKMSESYIENWKKVMEKNFDLFLLELGSLKIPYFIIEE